MICPLCSNTAYREKYLLGKYRLMECTECSLVRLEHDLSNEQIKKVYRNNYFQSRDDEIGYKNYLAAENALRLTFKKRVGRIIRRIGKTDFSLLDVGAGYGFFVSECLRAGIHAEGVELSTEATAFARDKLKVPVIQTALEDFTSIKQYDVLTAWDVIEHLEAPDQFLRKAAVLLKPGGHLFLTTGDIDSAVAKISGKSWHLFNLPEHLFFFSTTTLKKMLKKSGFGEIVFAHPSNYYNLGYILERFSKKILKRNLPSFLKETNFFTRFTVPLNLFDILEVSATKK